ncbi:MAG: isoleucine--tRNA ligase [Candidatus Sumerlaeia bacterium]|nr:isoleucine--tRNA ligase [Candidatus Sumerlaeia bacterium]
MATDAAAPDYRSTVLLPKTDFPQKANLPQREPERLKRWLETGIAERAQEQPGRPDFVMHDGPPYANANIHLGHVLNKVLKDFVIRLRCMSGYRVRFVPGWDCHGLPIEQKVIEDLQAKKQYADKTPLEIRALCHAYANKWKNAQAEQFQRLGVMGDYENPYMTLHPQYEVEILRALKVLNERGYIYKGLKTVLWDPIFETALAEAEIEYEEKHVSPSVHVRFPIVSGAPLPELAGAKVVIWTTTPWTLPANLGITLHPEFDYVAYRVNGETLVVARGLLEQFAAETGLAGGEVVAEFKGAIMDRVRCAHPIFPGRESLVMIGHHVNLEQGTGCVHTAPGHGADDFAIGREYGLEAYCPVNAKGCFDETVPEFAGEFVFKANAKIIEKLQREGTLVKAGTLTHSYPYSWRSRKPVITRATEQWFMDVDKDGLRQKALKSIDDVRWVPDWGYERIVAMVTTRPDWCLSRQRHWGVPIPALRDKQTGKSFLDAGVFEKVMGYVATEGTDCWFGRPVEDFLTDELKANGGAERYAKDFDILDVWFESGASHLAVLNEHHKLSWPADLYLEGSDQHRGWFQTSLWVSLGVKDRPPFKTVLTHGFVLDEKGQAMSKSLGNVIPPETVISKFGADVLRMWVASEDYRRDVKIGGGHMEQVAENYRRFRNTVRFLLSNLFDFAPERDAVPYERLAEDDRWILAELSRLVRTSVAAYDAYEFHRVYHAMNEFCVSQLGKVYLDCAKDRLYCSAPDDAERRACQTVLHELAKAMLKVYAPIAAFTCEEAWEFLPAEPGRPESVHLDVFPKPPRQWDDTELLDRWKMLLALRDAANRRVEALRAAKEVGGNPDAKIVLETESEPLLKLAADTEFMKRLVIVSGFEARRSAPGEPEPELEAFGVKARLSAAPADGAKCVRCRTYHTNLGTDPNHPALCVRCTGAVRRVVA